MDPQRGIPSHRKKLLACFNCPIGYMPFFEMNKGTRGEGFRVNTLMAASMLDITDPDGILKAWLMMNELGLDADFTASTCAWAFECYEKGLLSLNETDNLRSEWGNLEAFIEIIKKIAKREGVGNLLTDGPLDASKKVGKGSAYFVYHVKGNIPSSR